MKNKSFALYNNFYNSDNNLLTKNKQNTFSTRFC